MRCSMCGDLSAADATRCDRCGEQFQRVPLDAPSYSFTPNRFQFGLLYLMSVGLYHLYWLVKIARVMGYIANDKNRPLRLLWFLLPIANIFLYFQFFRDLGDAARRSGVKDVPSLPILAISAVVLGALWRLPDNWWYICLLAFVPTAIVQSYFSDMQKRLWPGTITPYRFRWGDWLVIIVGGILLLLNLLNVFLPSTPSEAATVAVLPITLGVSAVVLIAFWRMDAKTPSSPAPDAQFSRLPTLQIEKDQSLDKWTAAYAQARASMMALIQPLVMERHPEYKGVELLTFLELTTHFMIPAPAGTDIADLMRTCPQSFSSEAKKIAADALYSASDALRAQIGLAAYSCAMMLMSAAYFPNDPLHPDLQLLRSSLTCLEEALKYGPDRASYYSAAAQVCDLLHDLKAGYDYATQAMDSDPHNPEAWRMAGLASIGIDRYAEAEERLLRARELRPSITGVDEPLALARARR
jgi:hypothetical protein